MVKSGLDEELFTTPGAVPRVSQYRLAAHLGAALVLYTGMVHTANTIKRDWKYAMGGESVKIAGVTGADRLKALLDNPAVKRFGKWSTFVGGMVLLTAVSGECCGGGANNLAHNALNTTGAFVAGLDAGLIYNEFPTMGGRLMPPTEEMMDPRYAKAADKSDKWWRNLLENPTTVQFDHRALVSSV
jgi:cytochrome c oxidase assembly protein subunit 15